MVEKLLLKGQTKIVSGVINSTIQVLINGKEHSLEIKADKQECVCGYNYKIKCFNADGILVCSESNVVEGLGKLFSATIENFIGSQRIDE